MQSWSFHGPRPQGPRGLPEGKRQTNHGALGAEMGTRVMMRLQVAGRFSGLGPPGGRQAGTPGGGGGSRKMRRGFDALVFAGRGEQAGRREAARRTEEP